MNDETQPRDDQPTAESPTAEKPTEVMPPDPPPPRAGRPRRLLRSPTDRMVFGVAGGLGRYFGIDPVIVRIAFGVSVFLGGIGILVYLALAVFVPSGEGDNVGSAYYQRSRWLGVAAGIGLALLAIPALGAGLFWDEGWGWGPWGLIWVAIAAAFGFGLYTLVRGGGDRGEATTSGSRIVATVFLTLFVLVVFPALVLAATFVSAIGHGVAAAVVVGVLGLGLLVASFFGGARWLIIPAVALATGVGIAAAADLEFPASIGEREYRPAAVSSIPADGYEIGIGHLLVDLRDIEWGENEVVSLDVEAGIGQVEVLVPESVCVAAVTHAGAGELAVTGERNDGYDVDSNRNVGATSTPRLELNGEIDLGQLQVINDDEADLEGDFRHFGPGPRGYRLDEDEQRHAAAAACASRPMDETGIDGGTGKDDAPEN